MAINSQLDEYYRCEKEHNDEVALVKKKLEQAIPTAKAQLAVSLSRGEHKVDALPVVTGRRNAPTKPLDITLRKGFEPSNPAIVLSSEERRRLPDASLVVDALQAYMDLTLRLLNQRRPRVSKHGVTKGSI